MGFDPLSPKTWKIWNPITHNMTNTANVIFDEVIRSVDGAVKSPVSVLDDLFVNGILRDDTVKPVSDGYAVPDLADIDSDVDDDDVVAAKPIASRTRSHISASAYSVITNFAVKLKLEHLITPNTPKQAEKSEQADEWKESMETEMNSWVKNECISVMLRSDMPSGCMALGHKWVYKVKTNVSGAIERFKSRCTILGNLQREGFDYDEVFAPVVRATTIRALVALSAARGYVLHQMDVDTAFLYGVLPDDIPVYTTIPHGYPVPAEFKAIDPNRLVARVNKAVYGLKQSPRLWNECLDSTMLSYGFNKSPSDPCMYYRDRGGEEVYVAVFVDDLVIAGSSLEAVNEFKSEMKSRFNMKDIGLLNYCLGIEIVRNKDSSISLKQTKYIDDMITRFGLEKAHSEPTPMIPNIKLSKSMCPKTDAERVKAQAFPYREIVGSVMYLMVSTRPDIAYAVGQLSMHMNDHGTEHHAAALHLLRYIKGTRSLGITYQKGAKEEIVGYSDSDWAANVDTRRSTTGNVFYLCGGPISWRSKVQPTVALSSTEAEYMALTSAAQEAMALKMLADDFHIVLAEKSVLIYEDNQGAIAMSQNPVMHKTAKHISIKQHFIREKVQNGDVRLEYISTDRMIADALTKSLSKVIFYNLRDKLMGNVM
jgi:hypothetical protein